MSITVLSLGWGVQSFTLAAMAALGDIPMPDLTIHADTTWEREGTYAFAEKWTPWLSERGITVVTVRSKRAHIPKMQSQKSQGQYILIPAFTETKKGIGRMKRQCTGDWKIEPQQKAVKAWLKLAGLPKDTPVVKLLGISLDEWERAKTSSHKNTTHSYPLLDKRMTRMDCVRYLLDNGLEMPPKSSCVMCPFHNAQAWQAMKREAGNDWQRACAYDEEIRLRKNPDGSDNTPMYCHRSLKALPEAVVLPEELPFEQQAFLDDDVTCDSGYCFL